MTAKTDVDHVEPYGEVEWQEVWDLYRCPQCGHPTLQKYDWSDVFSDPDVVAATRLYPSPRSYSAIPAEVRKEIEAGQLVKTMNPGLYAVCIRRMLEAVCRDQGAKGQSLFDQLQDLANQGKLPQVLVDATNELRVFGNIGAHVGEVEVLSSDIPLLNDLAEAVLEYLYRAPATVDAVRTELANRRAITAGQPSNPPPAGT